jgi:hypothetical protein
VLSESHFSIFHLVVTTTTATTTSVSMALTARALLALGALVTFGMAVAQTETAPNCTESEAATSTELIGAQGAGLPYCTINRCTRECVATATALVATLPNCVNVDWSTNFYETMLTIVTLCESGSTSGSQAVVGACSDEERNATTTFLEENGRLVGTHCLKDVCSSDCVADLTTITENVPDCLFDDISFNYYQELSDLLASCNGTSDPITDDGTSGSIYSLCSSAETILVTIVDAAYGKEYATECATDSCTSACVEVSNALLTELADCMDAEGNYFYESILGASQICEFASSGWGVDSLDGSTADGSVDAGSSTTGSVDVASSNGAHEMATLSAAAAVASIVIAASHLM